jgi:iron complex outermembrane recepter protein
MINRIIKAGIFTLILLQYWLPALAQEADTANKNLEAVTVTGRYYRKYNTNTVSSALRITTPLLQLSQNIQTLNATIIRDQAAFNTTDGLTRNVSGVVRQEVGNNLGPYIFMRGGQISPLRNGVDMTPFYRGPVPDDAAVIDRLEFIKGPSLFMNNMGDAAGSFNVMTKQPTGTKHFGFTAMTGSWDFYRLAADLDGTLGKSKKLQYRLNAMGMKSRSFVQFDFNNRVLIAPVLKYLLNSKSYISAEYIFQNFSYAMHSPIVMTPNGFASLPRNFSIHETSLKPYHPTDQNGFLTYNNQINKRWSVTARLSFLQNDSKGAYMWVTGVNTTAPNVLLRNPKYDLTRYLVYSQQAFVNGSFATGRISHNIVAGVDVNQKKYYADNYVEYNKDSTGKLVSYPLDIHNPVYGAVVPNYNTPGGVKNGNTRQTARYVSAYALDEFLLFKDKLRVMVGVRATWLKTYNSVSGTVTSSDDAAFTPRFGLSYAVSKTFSAYALYDNTFQPQYGIQGVAHTSGTTTTYTGGNAVSPLHGSIVDIGLKKDWAGGRWNTTVAVYRIHRRNISEAIPTTVYRTQIGSSRSEGIDVDVKGEVVKGLNLVVNYAYNDSKITESATKTLVGSRTPMYVKHIQNTWLHYTLPAKLLQGFGLALGYQYMGGRGERFSTATSKEVPDYFRLDGGLNWRNRKVAVNLLVNNLTNRNSIATPWFRNGLYYWVPNAPRNFRLSFSYDL